jgi:hypothetical protein
MALTVWTTKSGNSLGTFQEGTLLDLLLPVENDTGVTYSIISGNLPGGLYIRDNHIIGHPFEVVHDTTSTFVIRAKLNNQISDRTFSITITNTNGPEFITPSGDLPVGINGQLYVLGNTYVDFQLQVIDPNIAAGAKLRFFIESNSGRLPPGLSLTEGGRIVGFAKPAITIVPADGNGSYDYSYYDAVAYDFAALSTNGYDSYTFDHVFYDFSTATNLPKQLNTKYQFRVTVTDGNNSSRQQYTILVIGDNYVTADNTIIHNVSQYTSDVSSVIAPVWKTDSNLGTYRADNYVTIPLETYDRENVVYTLEPINAEQYATTGTLTFIPKTRILETISSSNEIIIFEAVTAGFEAGMPVAFSSLYLTSIATAINASGVITVTSTEGVSVDMPIVFSGTSFGDIVPDQIYYVHSVTGATTLTISEIYQGIKFTSYDDVGSMSVIIDGPFGGIVTDKVYWIKSIIDNSHITISETLNGPEFELTDGHGNLTITNIDNTANFNYITTFNTKSSPIVGKKLTFDGRVTGATGKIYTIAAVESLGNEQYRITTDSPLEVNLPNDVGFIMGGSSIVPPDMQYDVNSSELAGIVPYQPTVTKTYTFTVTATRISTSVESASRSKLFTLTIIGNIDSVINWTTGSNLGTIQANFVSNLVVKATTTITNAVVVYTLIEGSLPPGLKLDASGEIVGRVNQFANSSEPGLTTFDNGMDTTFDLNIIPPLATPTLFDRIFTFTVKAMDQYGYSAAERTFTIVVDAPDNILYSNLSIRPFMPLDQRQVFQNFISNTSVFTPSSIYRPNDSNFGIQKTLSMLIYAGIETKSAAEFVGAIGLNHKRKQFYFGDIKTAIAYIPETKTAVYEVVYVEMVDPLTIDNLKLPLVVKKQSLQTEVLRADNSVINQNLTEFNQYITVDSTGYESSSPRANRYYPNSISNWRKRIAAVGLEEQNYMPLWMRTIQPGTKSPPGFTLAIPLCYCKVGTSADILANIKNNGFDFKQLSYIADRYTIDAVEGYSSDKYLVFRNDRITV